MFEFQHANAKWRCSEEVPTASFPLIDNAPVSYIFLIPCDGYNCYMVTIYIIHTYIRGTLLSATFVTLPGWSSFSYILDWNRRVKFSATNESPIAGRMQIWNQDSFLEWFPIENSHNRTHRRAVITFKSVSSISGCVTNWPKTTG